MQAFHEVWNVPEWMPEYLICEDYTGCGICLNKPEYTLIMSKYDWMS